MRFDIITIFPDFFAGPLEHGIVRRAREAGLIDVRVQDLREFAHDRHRTVDDRPFGGGEGMVLKPEPIFEAVESLMGIAPVTRTVGDPTGRPYGEKTAVVLLSASGKLFRQADARRLAGLERVALICGRYEGVDERVAEHLATDEFSIGDFVLSGGELPAALIVDAVTRLLPGALGNEASSAYESFSANVGAGLAPPLVSAKEKGEALRPSAAGSGQASLAPTALLLDHPHYTRPAEFRGWAVPEVLIGGHHEQVRKWRAEAALEKTRRNRPDLLDKG